MSIHTHILSSAVSAVLLLMDGQALAAESTSYRLYEDIDHADRTNGESASYRLEEDGETWMAYPLTGQSFQIVTTPPATGASSSVASSVAEGGDGGGGDSSTPESGGHRGHRTNESSRSSAQSQSSAATSAHVSAASSSMRSTPDGVVIDVPDVARDPPRSEDSDISYASDQTECRIRYFALVDAAEQVCPLPTHAAAPAVPGSGRSSPLIVLTLCILSFLAGWLLRDRAIADEQTVAPARPPRPRRTTNKRTRS